MEPVRTTVLPPGTLLQLMYLRERIRNVRPGAFIEIGAGSGEITSLLLELGWRGRAHDLEPRTVERLQHRFSREIAEQRLQVSNQDFFAIEPSSGSQFDLIISCMVMEHFDDDLELKFLTQSQRLLREGGMMIGLVPASPRHWGIEDDIAGHCRRYTRTKLESLMTNKGWRIGHIAGLTYPVSNVLLPISNFLVQRAEASKMSLSNLEKTKASGIRNVKFKTHFPTMLSLILNRTALAPLHWLQKACSGADAALVLYFEAGPRDFPGVRT